MVLWLCFIVIVTYEKCKMIFFASVFSIYYNCLTSEILFGCYENPIFTVKVHKYMNIPEKKNVLKIEYES